MTRKYHWVTTAMDNLTKEASLCYGAFDATTPRGCKYKSDDSMRIKGWYELRKQLVGHGVVHQLNADDTRKFMRVYLQQSCRRIRFISTDTYQTDTLKVKGCILTALVM